MPGAVDIEVNGLLQTQRQLERTAANLHGTPVLNAFREATLILQRDAKINSPVDTGRLRASITPEVQSLGEDILGIVGSNVVYAPFMELGTRPHWPPLSALEVWARRHGTTAYIVCRAISKRGNLARHYLQNAFEKNRDWIIARIERGVQEALQ